MNVKDLELELHCYKLNFNPELDMDNITMAEWAEFNSLRDELKAEEEVIEKEARPLIEALQNSNIDEIKSVLKEIIVDTKRSKFKVVK